MSEAKRMLAIILTLLLALGSRSGTVAIAPQEDWTSFDAAQKTLNALSDAASVLRNVYDEASGWSSNYPAGFHAMFDAVTGDFYEQLRDAAYDGTLELCVAGYRAAYTEMAALLGFAAQEAADLAEAALALRMASDAYWQAWNNPNVAYDPMAKQQVETERAAAYGAVVAQNDNLQNRLAVYRQQTNAYIQATETLESIVRYHMDDTAAVAIAAAIQGAKDWNQILNALYQAATWSSETGQPIAWEKQEQWQADSTLQAARAVGLGDQQALLIQYHETDLQTWADGLVAAYKSAVATYFGGDVLVQKEAEQVTLGAYNAAEARWRTAYDAFCAAKALPQPEDPGLHRIYCDAIESAIGAAEDAVAALGRTPEQSSLAERTVYYNAIAELYTQGTQNVAAADHSHVDLTDAQYSQLQASLFELQTPVLFAERVLSNETEAFQTGSSYTTLTQAIQNALDQFSLYKTAALLQQNGTVEAQVSKAVQVIHGVLEIQLTTQGCIDFQSLSAFYAEQACAEDAFAFCFSSLTAAEKAWLQTALAYLNGTIVAKPAMFTDEQLQQITALNQQVNTAMNAALGEPGTLRQKAAAAAQMKSAVQQIAELIQTASSGSYGDNDDKPVAPTAPAALKALDGKRITFYRKQAYTTFSAVDTADVTWKSSNTKVLAVNEATGAVTVDSYRFATIGSVNVYAYMKGISAPVATVSVNVDWQPWQWILVVLLFGWMYL